MLSYLKKIVNIKLKLWLLLANVLLVIILITFSNLGILPLSWNDFIFFVILILLFALYRPGWAFLFFIGTIALENINLAPEELGIMLRPYQFIGALTLLAIAIRFISKRINFDLPKLKWTDFLIILISISSFAGAIFSSNKLLALKLSIILSSFAFLYYLTRIFIRSLDDLKKILPFFLSSALIVSVYGIWQNIRFAKGLKSFAIMPGRPNATFTEPDWLGIFLVLCIAIVFAMIYFERNNKSKAKNIFLFSSLTIFLLTLILTVSRSAWLGAFIIYVIYIFIVWTNLKFKPKHWNLWETVHQKLFIIGALALALILICSLQLTTFKLFQRAQSTGGMQKITVSCEKPILIEETKSLSELEKYSCHHINLEEIETEIANGRFITETFRPDPTVNIRQEIYQKSWDKIKNNPILGIGWGNIGKILGTDKNGNALNSSNIFLEIWLGSGIIGFLSFAILLIYISISGIKKFINNDLDQKVVGLFIILGVFAIIIPNLFNAGILLGIVWIFLGISLI